MVFVSVRGIVETMCPNQYTLEFANRFGGVPASRDQEPGSPEFRAMMLSVLIAKIEYSAFLVWLGFMLIVPTAGAAQDVDETTDLIDWYYAAAFGTGVYNVGDRKVTVFRIPFAYRFGPLRERWSAKLLLPLTVGFYDFAVDDLLGLNFNEHFGTVSFLPGVEVEIPVSSRWTLIPNVHVGAGTEVQGENYAAIYTLGIKSRLRFPLNGAEFMLGNAFKFAGYSAREGANDNLSRFVTGLNYSTPPYASVFGRQVRLGLHLVHLFYFDRVNFLSVAGGDDESLRNEFEAALTLEGDRPWRLFGLSLERLGIGIRYGEDLKAVRLVGGFPY